MSTLPAGEGIGAETAVNQRQCRFYRAILHIHIEGTQLLGCQHALVNDSAGGQAGNIEIFAAAELAIADIVLSLTSNAVQLALESVIINIKSIQNILRRLNKNLSHEGHALAGFFAQNLRMHRHGTPAQHALAISLHNALKMALHIFSLHHIRGQENKAHSIFTGLRQINI